MKKLFLIMIAAIMVLASCNDYETYGDQKEKERNAISKFIADSSITVISEDVFVQQGYKTADCPSGLRHEVTGRRDGQPGVPLQGV